MAWIKRTGRFKFEIFAWEVDFDVLFLLYATRFIDQNFHDLELRTQMNNLSLKSN